MESPQPPNPAGRLLAPGPLRIFTAIAALVIISMCGWSSVQGMGKPFAGFFVWENLFVPAAGSNAWTGVNSGLQYHSWIKAVDGATVRTGAEFHEIIAEHQPGDIITYRVEREGQEYTVSVPVMKFTSGAFFASTGVFLFDALALMTLALVMVYLKPDGDDAGAVFYFATTLALFLATAIDLFGPYQFRTSYFFFAGLAPTTALYTLSRFPMPRRVHPSENILLLTCLGLSLTYGLASNWLFFRNHDALLYVDRLYHVFLGGSILIAVAFFAWYFVTTKDHATRQRTKIVLVAIVGAFVPVVAIFGFYAGLASIPFNILTIFFVFFPAGIGYAIAKHDLFDIDRFIKRALTYLVLSALVIGLYTLGIGIAEYLFDNFTGGARRLTTAVLILASLLVFNPSRQRVQEFVDRLYDRRRYEYRDVVHTTSRRFSSILDFESLLRTTLELIDETVQPNWAEIVTVSDSGVLLRRALLSADLDGPETTERIRVCDSPVPELAPALRALSERDLASGGLTGPATTQDQAPERTLAAVMRLDGRPVGMIVVGRRRTGSYLTGEDADLLHTMCDQLAVALENAQAYGTINGLAVNLEDRNRELATANDDLQRAQNQLINAERLAAIGELAGSVAHAIRNPLAGIKMAAEDGRYEFTEHDSAGNFLDIMNEADRLELRITHLLDFARPFEPQIEVAALSPIVEGAVSVSQARAKQAAVALSWRDGSPDFVEIDPMLFEQVIVELVANAIDAAGEGGRVEVAAAREGKDVVITVSDSGAGIAPGKIDQIFDLFFTTKKTGTGFGLATVKKIVERHGGTVQARNAIGKGACFTISLPSVPPPA
ncbi:MAG: signal transduction histidine kinase [Hyphomicrobiaceae bacterium]|jgi:signal transduction histidine kinase